jgi:putative PEP-CTERM system histidine kinase
MVLDQLLTVLVQAGFWLGAIACTLAASRLAAGRRQGGGVLLSMIAALGFTALWSVVAAVSGTDSAWEMLAETARNLSWLAVIHRYFTLDVHAVSLKPVRWVIAVMAVIEVLQPVLLGLVLLRGQSSAAVILHAAILLRLLVSVGGLVLVHNLYVSARSGLAAAARWPAAGLAVMWLIDLNHYTVAYLADSYPVLLAALRGFGAVLFAGLAVLGAADNSASLRFRPSRTVAFQSASLLVIGAYLLSMWLLAQWLGTRGGDFAAAFQVAFVAAATGLALITLPSRRIRGWLRVTLTKHLFQHRYDYREEWLRFTRTISQDGTGTAPLQERVVQAMADITDSPAGLLLVPGDHGELVLAARWQWPTADVPAEALARTAVGVVEQAGYIVDLEQVRAGHSLPGLELPDWLISDARAWAMVPLLHFDRLVGLVVLARPPLPRQLDWEDFDLLRVAGQQLASYLAEHASQESLAEASRFDDFSRRIAFVMHDVKNLASQLSLLARNAERHADNPEFRADMLLTLRNSADKLNMLLARLSRYGAGSKDNLQPLRADQLAASVVEGFAAMHQVELVRSDNCEVIANAEPLEQALVHLVQNAIEASASGQPVFVSVSTRGTSGIIEIIDSGAGMSPEFVRSKLFRPFISSKQGGFGIGAYEARELLRAMNGRLDVESREGLGSRFVIHLPLASTSRMLESMAGRDKQVA